MRVSRIFYTGLLASEQVITLGSNASQYVLRVLRLRAGDALVVFNGAGGEYPATLMESARGAAQVQLGQQQAGMAASPLTIHLGQGISRGERMDYAIQKAVELGAASITPLFTARCGVKLTPDRVQKRMQHWQGVVIAACEQSGRCDVPVVQAPQMLADWLSAAVGLRLICDVGCAPAALTESNPPAAVSVLIGPEGGFSQDELACAQAQQPAWQSLSLGPRVLRTETATVAALALLQAQWGDLVF